MTGVHCTLVWLIDIKNFFASSRAHWRRKDALFFSLLRTYTHASEAGPNAGHRAPGLMLFLGSGWTRDE